MRNTNKKPQTIEESFAEMRRLSKSFEEKNEIIKESSDAKVDDSVIKTEADRLKTIARVDEWISAGNVHNQFSANAPTVLGYGQTVNTFMDPKVNSGFGQQMDGNKLYNPNYTYLQPAEALDVSLKRAIESGAPVNNLGFYEEVNFYLNNMGFISKSPLDIKQALLKMLKDK